MSRRFNRRSAAAFGVVCLLAAAGAFAYWTIGGSGTGSATTGTNASVVVIQTSTVTGLYPGGPAQALSGNFNNANPGTVRVASVTATLGSITGSSGTPACTIADYQINNATATVDADIAPGNGNGAWSGPTLQMLNSGTNQDACKNVTVNLTYTSN